MVHKNLLNLTSGLVLGYLKGNAICLSESKQMWITHKSILIYKFFFNAYVLDNTIDWFRKFIGNLKYLWSKTLPPYFRQVNKAQPSRPNTLDNTTTVAPPDREEVAMAIQRLKLNKAAVMMASLLNFLKQEEMNWFAACTTFSETYGHWQACQVIGVLVCSAQYLKRAMLQSAAIIVA